MTQIKTLKPRVVFTPEQHLDDAKLMVDEGYSNAQVRDISGAGASAPCVRIVVTP